jgi:hypothetical protein
MLAIISDDVQGGVRGVRNETDDIPESTAS